jgi:hypothetical protein
VIHGVLWNGSDHVDKFNELFEDVGQFPGDPGEDYYQGMSFTRVIRRKTDGRLFGFTYWEDISKHGESFVESNADEHGIKVQYDADWEPIGGEPFVFLPVTEFKITGYTTEESK